MFRRLIIERLEAWRNDPFRKPLVLRGPRQVGKTTVVNQFGESFPNYLYLNLEDRALAGLFEQSISIAQLVDLLFLRSRKRRVSGDVLIFIDEIQNSPAAMASLRYFYEDCPDYFVVAAGSLLENVVDVQASFPVGRVQFIAMRPCSFVEFLGAIGCSDLLEILKNQQVSRSFHDELLHQFQQYVLVGGMPEVVQRYALSHDVFSLNTTLENLLVSYQDDAEKYARKGKLHEVVRFVLDKGWTKAGEIVTLGRFAESEYKSREVGEAFRLLEKAMLVELVYPSTSTQMPAIPELKRMPKLFWLDVGLVNYRAGARRDIIGAGDMLDVWKGRIAEQVVAQELLALNNLVSARRAFWVKGKGLAEVDFLYNFRGAIVPIEVKNGHNAHLRSLQVFMQQSPVDVAVRIWTQPFSVDEIVLPGTNKKVHLINLPIYMLSRLDAILGDYLV